MGDLPNNQPLVVQDKSLGSLTPEAAELAKKLIDLLKVEVQAAPEVLNPQLVTGVLIKVLTGHVASCRVVTKSKFEMATNLAGFVFADYLEAHGHIVSMEARNQPAG